VTSSEDWFKFDGKELRCYQVTYNPYRNDTGQITHAVVVTHDITARKACRSRDEKGQRSPRKTGAAAYRGVGSRPTTSCAMKSKNASAWKKPCGNSEDRYRSVSRDMPAMVCRYLPDGTLTFANIRFKKTLFQVSEREPCLSTNIFTFFSDTERRRMKNRLQQLRPHAGPWLPMNNHTRNGRRRNPVAAVDRPRPVR
jgi:two-component system cell cycle sensor histidine kinase/response regulator CckA